MAPLVSVIVLSYNHEKYIRQALNSIVTQKTDFPFEVYVGDDASTDKTPQIIQAYADKYPELIKPVLRKKNLGANSNYVDIVKRCRGKYLAFLDGDDFWNSSTKLQQHVNFLEKHPEYVGICGWVNFVNQKGKPVWHIQGDHESLFYKHTYTMHHYQKGYFPGQGSSAMFRNIYRDLTFEWEELYTIDPLIGDQITTFLFNLDGRKTYVTHKRLSSYRYISSAISDNFSSKINVQQDTGLYFFRYYNALENKYKQLTGKRISLRKRKCVYLIAYINNIIRFPSLKLAKALFTMLREEKHPILLLLDALVIIWERKTSSK